MDFHPIIVHFPIALLTIYSLMELIRPKILQNNETWFYIKTIFIIIGTIGALFALTSGDIAAHQYTNNELEPLIDTHEGFAGAATKLFFVMSITYILTFINRKYKKYITRAYNGKLAKLWQILIKIKNIIHMTPIIYIIAIAGLILITITGALGGALIYGPDTDPLIQLVHNIFL